MGFMVPMRAPSEWGLSMNRCTDFSPPDHSQGTAKRTKVRAPTAWFMASIHVRDRQVLPFSKLAFTKCSKKLRE